MALQVIKMIAQVNTGSVQVGGGTGGQRVTPTYVTCRFTRIRVINVTPPGAPRTPPPFTPFAHQAISLFLAHIHHAEKG